MTRRIAQESKKTPTPGTCPTAIDLYCGVGGLSLGVHWAGFHVAAAVDNDPLALESYRNNFPGTKCIEASVDQLKGRHLLRRAGVKPGDIDLLFGGPPCQGFSLGGRREPNDPRNQQLLEFARFVTEIRPRHFMVENVQGLLYREHRATLDRFVEMVTRAGYDVVQPIQCLNAADFGVPQRRIRVFVLGSNKGERKLAYPSPGASPSHHDPKVRDAITDLPHVDDFDELFESDTYEGTLGRPSKYAWLLRQPRSAFGLRDIADGPGRLLLTGCLRTRHAARIVRRFQRTKPGGQESISRFYRLAWDDVAPTLRSGTGSDRGSYTAPRPIHPEYPRCITVREAARLHSFPDWFEFHPTRWHGFMQVGNSVPPLLARAVASSMVSGK